MVTGLDVVTTTLVVPPVMVGPPWRPTGEPPNKDVGIGNAPSGDVNDDVDMVKKSGFMWPVEFSTKVILILSLHHGYYSCNCDSKT